MPLILARNSGTPATMRKSMMLPFPLDTPKFLQLHPLTKSESGMLTTDNNY